MKHLKILTLGVAAAVTLQAYAGDYTPKWGNIKTEWGEKVTPENVWQSYPRPQLKRADWMNLNGLWEYAITPMGTEKSAVAYEGEILVPFAVESALSGVKRTFTPEDLLWYRRTFELSDSWKGKNVILNFGAVDFECSVWVNGKLAGSHRGGSNPFSFDITKYLKRSGSQLLEVCVADPTDAEANARGKQSLEPRRIWYTPVSGIWQTVWAEAVNKTHFTQILPEADIDTPSVDLTFKTENAKGDEEVSVEIFDGEKVVKTVAGKVSDVMHISLENPQLWSPETPKLYHFKAVMTKSGKVLDEVSSYFALREVEVAKDEAGYNRICLNHKPVFQMGTLDQGWWPDGLLTPPSEEAMIWDMKMLKDMGFNTLRKHIKVEPELYYYYADSLGLMIWQDMPSGFVTEKASEQHVKFLWKEDWNAPAEHSEQWQSELFGMIDWLRFYPSITTWVVFNEGWGQFNTVEIVSKVLEYDRTRIINGVSGWTDRGVGHLFDVHNYPFTSMILSQNNGGRVSVLGEFGGYGWAVEGHLWNPDMQNWGYRNIDGAVALADNYTKVIYDLETLIPQGLSAAIYTQTTDVEGEVNGLATYDRKVVKLPVNAVHAMHDRLYGLSSASDIVELVADGQSEGEHTVSVSINGAASCEASLPLPVKKDTGVVAEAEFDSDQCYRHLSFWLNASGNVEVRLNGHLIFDQEVEPTNHYGQFNVSDFSQYMVKGKNVLQVKTSKANSRVDFDFGLRAF